MEKAKFFKKIVQCLLLQLEKNVLEQLGYSTWEYLRIPSEKTVLQLSAQIPAEL